ncbi:MAG TPA: glycosyltransferase [Rubrobacter sp.]|nr:glycosyltransferase [Rubrobacter sp.]
MNENTGAGRDVDGSRPFSRSRPEGGKVSVVIPCYNQARFLGEAIQSVLCQGYPDLEIIVVDDGSEDSTEEVASGYTKKDPRVRLIRQDNKGLAAARNRGLSEAGGKYVVFLDSDDRLVLEALEVGIRELEAHPGCAFVSGICRKITADGSIVPEWEQFRVRDDPYLELLRSCPVYVPAVMYRRSVFDAVGGFDTSYKAAEDYDLYYRILECFPVYCHDTLVAEIRRHEANMTRDRTLMLKYNMAALRSQRKRVKEDARYKAAYKAGERLWRDWHGAPVVNQIRAHLQGGRWWQGVEGIVALLRYYPQGILLVANRGVERERVARRLRHQQRELETHRYKLQQLRKLSEGGAEYGDQREKELQSAMKEERRNIRHHKERVRHLASRMEKLDWRRRHRDAVRKGWASVKARLSPWARG